MLGVSCCLQGYVQTYLETEHADMQKLEMQDAASLQ